MALELPEIMKISVELREILIGKSIKSVLMSEDSKKLIEWGFTNLNKRDIAKSNIEDVTSKGHYIFIKFENGYNLVFGDLIGKILYHKTNEVIPKKYKILFELQDKTYLTFHTSLYGYAVALTDEEIKNHKYIGHKGISPLDKNFTFEYFKEMLKSNEKQLVKKIQSMYDYMTGFQNGYFQDILFEAKILPTRKIYDLQEEEKIKLYNAIKEVVLKAVELGGNKEEVDIYNKNGNYERVMGKDLKGKKCPRCGIVIKQKNILGSNSYYCEGCQK